MTDPAALRSEMLFRLFTFYLRLRFRARFHAVRYSGPLPNLSRERPIIVYGNHPSWWDPALYMMLADHLFRGRPGFGPMEAHALERYAFFRRLGIFGVEKQSMAGARRFLDVARQVLEGGGPGGRAMIWITAEGDFNDSRQRPVRLRPGISHLARIVPGALLVPIAVEYTFWNESRPELLLRFGAPIAADPGLRPAEWTRILQDALTLEMDALEAQSMARDKTLFSPVLRGRSGSSMFYDSYRRVRAAVAGKPFSAAHEEEA